MKKNDIQSIPPIVINKKNAFMSERFRMITTNLQFIKKENEDNIQTYVFTSAHKGEGKSFCALNLAVTYARQNKKVLLVDADLYKPKLTRQFKRKYADGLSTILASDLDPLELIEETNEENMFFLSSGIAPPNPLELINTQKMRDLIAILKQEFDLIIFDTPPVLLLNDGRILGSFCDAVVFTVKSGQTKAKDVEQAIDLVKRANGRVVGAILNAKKYGKKEMQTYSYY